MTEDKLIASDDVEPKTADGVILSTDPLLRKAASWGTVIGTAAFAGYFFSFLIVQSIKPSDPKANWLIKIFDTHYPATIGIALCSVGSFCIVLLLRATTGPIVIAFGQAKFEGASGPIILWILCFLANVLGLKMLWPLLAH